MPLVREEFAKVTKYIPGDFHIGRVINDSVSAKEGLYALSYGNIEVYSHDVRKLWNKYPNKDINYRVEHITGEFVEILKAMQIVDDYVKKGLLMCSDYKSDKLFSDIQRDLGLIARMQGRLHIAEICEDAAATYKKITKTIRKGVEQSYAKTVNRLDKSGNDIVLNDIRHGVPKFEDLLSLDFDIKV